MKKTSYLIFAILSLTGCVSLSGVDKKIEASIDEAISIAALAITYHQIQGAWPNSSNQLDNYFSNINIDPTMSKSQKAVDDCLYYLNEIKPIEFSSRSDDNLTLTYKNHKNRDVWIYLSTKNAAQNESDKNYLFSAKIQFPSNTESKMRETATSNSYLSKEQTDFLIQLVGQIAEGIQYIPYTAMPK